MTTEQLDALELAEDFADWQEAKGRDHPATRETHQKLEAELRLAYLAIDKMLPSAFCDEGAEALRQLKERLK